MNENEQNATTEIVVKGVGVHYKSIARITEETPKITQSKSYEIRQFIRSSNASNVHTVTPDNAQYRKNKYNPGPVNGRIKPERGKKGVPA